jgi:hypothetical protein
MPGEYAHFSNKCNGIYKTDPENKIAITSNVDETIWIAFQYLWRPSASLELGKPCVQEVNGTSPTGPDAYARKYVQ